MLSFGLSLMAGSSQFCEWDQLIATICIKKISGNYKLPLFLSYLSQCNNSNNGTKKINMPDQREIWLVGRENVRNIG